jgi:hypothetical protein
MKFFKLFGVTLAALFALGITTSSAFAALPDISITLGGVYPLKLEVTLPTAKTKLTNVVKENVKGEGLLIIYYLTELGHLGTFEALFTKTKKGSTACFSEEGGKKDPSEEILTHGSWHIVYTSLSPLQSGILYLVAPVTIKCGAEEVDVKGDTLSSVVSNGSNTEERTTLSGVLKGNEEGSPNIKFYENEGGTSIKAKLEANFGTGFKEADEEVEEPVTVTAQEGKMFVITGQ